MRRQYLGYLPVHPPDVALGLTVEDMSYQRERADDFDEASEFDLIDSAEDEAENDPEDVAAGEDVAALEEVNPADAAEQDMAVTGDEDEETRPE